ncbi:MAG: hypothetical protein U1E47_01690 [Rivihabitans pingtungensis]
MDKTLGDYKAGYSYTAAPMIVKGKVITGVSGGEFDVSAKSWKPATPRLASWCGRVR